jgi:quinol monooxygenase YgiN
MLIVTGLIEVVAENLDAARSAVETMMVETRKEPGCRVYEFSEVIGARGRFRVYEEWDNQAALDAHFKAPHMDAFRASLADIGILSRDICKVENAIKQPLD